MKVLVTGASGFIGRHVVNELRQTGHELYTERFDICNTLWTEEVFHDFRPDVVYHLAANAIIKENKDKPTSISHVNFIGTHNLLANCLPNTKFIFASSCAVYDCGQYDIATEEHGPVHPRSVYAATKLACEELIKAYTSLGKIQGLIFRLAANVGRFASHGVVPDLINKLRSDSETLEVLGDKPGSTKPYSYAGDTAAFMVQYGLAKWTEGWDTINVSSGDQLTSEQIANIIMEVLGIRKTKTWNAAGNWIGDNKVLKVSRYRALFCGFKPTCSTAHEAIIKAVGELR